MVIYTQDLLLCFKVFASLSASLHEEQVDPSLVYSHIKSIANTLYKNVSESKTTSISCTMEPFYSVFVPFKKYRISIIKISAILSALSKL